uniref:Uncharacterized protein n=1 Tax=Rhizophora mucronata TaxID=61149 RepID=A0A2P2L1V6_RHIMU
MCDEEQTATAAAAEEAEAGVVALAAMEDVEDYVWANEGEGSLPWDRLTHVFEFVQKGNQAYWDNHFEKAINYYSRANNIKPGDAIILGNRSAAYIRLLFSQ